jgi:hypothetical protein
MKPIHDEHDTDEDYWNRQEDHGREAAPDWKQLEQAVVDRIRCLAAVTGANFEGPSEWRVKIWKELVVPNVRLLAEFCANVMIGAAVDDASDWSDQ